MGYLVVLRYLIIFLLFLSARASRPAEIGYGPGFNSCGDSCQTGLRLFCTELRDAAQQEACWCRDVETYYEHMDSCLASCEAEYDQRGLLMRYRGVVCGAKDEEFEEYYMDRYGGEFYPNPLRNAPPPPLLLEEKSFSKTKSMTKTKTRTSMITKTRTSSKTSSTTSSSSSSSTPTSTAIPTETSDSSDSDSSSPLPVGAIAGIAAGSASVVIALILAGVIIWHRKNRIEKSPSATPPLNWPPNLERRVSVYYSPDDVGRTPTTPRAQAGNWQLPHPGQRVPSVATTIIEDSASDYDGSSSSGSTWTVIEEQEQFYDVDLGVAR